MKIGLLGHGTIGVGVDHIVKTVDGMEVTKILSLIVDDEMTGRTAADIGDITGDPEIDTVVEVMGGVHPAYEFITAAMKAGKNVVTANKAVVAAYYRELTTLAKEQGVSFRATACAGGGIPWLTEVERKNRTDEIVRIYGIMNGTTNYILSRMEDCFDPEGRPKAEPVRLEQVLKEAQELGYAERDPAADIDGYDVRRKVAISANVAYGVVIDEEQVPTFGIRTILPEDIAQAVKKGRTVRLIAEAARDGEGIAACVMPCLVRKDSPEAGVRSNFNLFTLCGKQTGTFKFYGQGAGRYPTAGNIAADLKDIELYHPGFYTDSFVSAGVTLGSGEARFYVRTAAPDDYLRSVAAEASCEKENVPAAGVYTRPVPTAEFLKWALEKQKTDETVFIAKVIE
ncbi:MAG: homoserine dehydrogenase [Lachnospiraceae bacterium]|nr:homoserine dehydrogenase [Lachnospiraceae bacterium]